jgi:nicotinate phosphoribosyltransferase
VEVAKQLRSSGIQVKGVRIDSGDLAVEARRVREVLDNLGASDIRILVSGSIDEYAIAAMEADRVPVDAYCIGTRLAVSQDAPSLDCAYKLQQYAGRPCRKHSQWKETWPGPRQVYRQYDSRGLICRDVLCCENESFEGCALLSKVMDSGRSVSNPPSLTEVRSYCAEQLATLPIGLSTLEHVAYSPAKVSDKQHALAAEIDLVAH